MEKEIVAASIHPPAKSDHEDSDEEDYTDGFQRLAKAKDKDRLLSSPINIDLFYATIIKLPNLKWYDYHKLPRKMKVTNTGNTVILSAKWEVQSPYITGGPLGDNKYIFADVHFHWGKTGLEGSEHLIDGSQCALEMHVVHIKKEYGTHTEAILRDDGVVILVYLYEIRFHHNPVLQKLLLNLEKIRQADSSTPLNPFEISRLVMPFMEDFYSYWGCINSKGDLFQVLWIVNRQVSSVSIQQLQLFHQLLDPSLRSITRNWRPVQSEDERSLFYVNPASPYVNQTMNPKPVMFQESLHPPSTMSAIIPVNQGNLEGILDKLSVGEQSTS